MTEGVVVRLELENFKSYRGKVVIGPFSDFTCVIGPNGSGKSNTMDAISFVLGVRASHLRGQNLRELIYSVEGEKAEKRAAVTLVFKNNAGKEVFFNRTIKAEGSSEYRIDDVVKTWEEYDEVLKSIHILTKAKNFLVFQGDVENVAAKKPTDLTALLELVSGSDQYKAEYEEKKKRKEETTAKMLDASSKRRGVGAEKNQYKMQKKEAERFRALTTEQVGLKRDMAIFQLYYIENELNTMKKELMAAKIELKDVTDKNKDENMQYEQYKKDYAELHKRSLAFMKGKQTQGLKQTQLQRQADKLVLVIKHSEDKLAEAQSLTEKIKKSGKQHVKDLEQLRKQLSTVKADHAAYEKKKAEEKKEVEGEELTESQYQEWKQLKQKSTTRTITVATEIQAVSRQQKSEQLQHKSLSLKMEQLEAREKQLHEAIASIQERREALVGTNKKNAEEIKLAKAELAAVKESIGDRDEKRQAIEASLQQVANELTELRFEKNESGRDRKFAETLEQMKQLFPGVKGKVHELCRIPDKKYQTAVTVAMGKSMDGIVVDTSACAMECISFLKEQRLAPMTFIPLESIKAGRVDERLRNLGGTCKPVLDCVQYDPSVDAAIRYAVGPTLVCDKMHEAKLVAFGDKTGGTRHKVVTIDGSCILKNGCIQGGQATMEKKAKKWNEQGYENKKRERDELVLQLDGLGDLTSLRNKELDINNKIANLQSSVDFNASDSTAADRKLETHNKELDAIKKQLRELQPQAKEMEKKITAFTAKIAGLEEKKTSIEKEIFADFEKKVKISDIQQYEEKRDRLQSEYATKDAEYKQLIGRLETQLEYAEKKAASKDLKNIEKSVTELQARLAKERSEQGTVTKELEKVNKGVADGTSEQEKIKKGMTVIDNKMKELKKTMGSKLEEMGTAKKKVTQKLAACQKLRSVRIATINKCGVEEIPLPTMPLSAKRKAELEGKRKKRKTEGGGAADVEDDDEEAEVEGGALQSSEPFSMSEDTEDTQASQGGAKAEMIIDFSGLKESLKKVARSSKDYQKQFALFDDQIQRLDAEIEKLAPNLKAMQRFADVESKFDGTTKEFEQCREEQKKAQIEFEAVAEKRYTKFMESFDVITTEIDKVYKVLTRDEQFPAGGTAYISLDNPAEPYNGGTKYNAMPITKRFREMEQLSGGEKTVAALALLFTIHRVHPSPFFILDEIDAALDHGNVMKVCNYVMSHCQDCQFIVISLKPEFFENATSLVGIYKDQETNASRVLTYDLAQHDEEGEEE